MSDIYDALRIRLDTMSTGFPETEKRSEIAILKQLFEEEEAELFLALSPILETPEAAAERLGRDRSQLATMMETMAQKGLLFRRRKDGVASYGTVPYVVGIMEFQVKNIETNRSLAKDMAIYARDGFLASLQSLSTPHQRAVPINTDIVYKWPVAPYEDAISILRDQKKIAVANCVCRTVARKVSPHQCDKPLETCMMFGTAADYYVENGMGREIDFQEALSILKLCDESALVIQPVNSKKAGAICACCGDCCGMLTSLKMQKKPAESVRSNYFAEIDEQECTGCEICLERCQMGAITVEDGTALMNADRCIGCGLCVTTCPAEAIALIRKPEYQIYEPPENSLDMYIRMGKERGMI